MEDSPGVKKKKKKKKKKNVSKSLSHGD